jgi:hypothetical protein
VLKENFSKLVWKQTMLFFIIKKIKNKREGEFSKARGPCSL